MRIGRVSYAGNGRVVIAELLDGGVKIGEITSTNDNLCTHHIELLDKLLIEHEYDTLISLSSRNGKSEENGNGNSR